MKTGTKIDLTQFNNGSENMYKHWLGMLYTEGLYYLAEEAGAHWLLDAIASHQPKARRDPMLRDFQIWTLTPMKNGTSGAWLKCWRDSSDKKPTITQKIEYTDFPFEAVGDFRIWVENGTMMLPSER